MVQPFANPIGGFTSGFSQGTQMGLLLRQQKEKQDARLEEIEAEKQKMTIKQMENNMAVMSDTDLPESMRLTAYNAFRPTWNKINPNSAMGELTEWPKEGSKYAQRALKIWQNPKYDQGTKLKALGELQLEAAAAGEKIDVTGVTEPIKEEQEAGRVQQALDIRALQQDPRFTEGLTQEQQAQVGAPSAERGLLARGGATGQALLKEGAKPGSAGLQGKFKEWVVTRDIAGIKTSKEDMEAYFRKGGKTLSDRYKEFENLFKTQLGRKPTSEEIRKWVIQDPYGILEPAAEAPAGDTAEGYLSTIGK